MYDYKEYIIFKKDSIRGYCLDVGNHKEYQKAQKNIKHIKF
jgi:hypothetical protein